MHAIEITTPGDAGVLCWTEVPDPTPGPGEVVVDVVAAGVNRADVAQRQGSYPPPPGASAYPGLECSGRISEVGPEVEGWSVGDEVCALLAGGGYAERVAVPEGQLLPVPAGVPLPDAAALPEVVCTVWSNLVMKAGLAAGETLLVHGGGSGIGTMAVQVATALGVRVIVTAGSQEKIDRCLELGAEAGVNYHDEDFVDRTRELTDGRGADVVLDIIGARYLPRNVEVLATDGRIAVIGLQGGRTGELDLGALLAKRGTIFATGLRGLGLLDKARVVAEVRRSVWPLIEAGRIRPVVDRRLPLADAAQGHRVLEESGHVGKVLLVRG